jgi:nitroreductase
MKEFSEFIRSRRSIRDFKPDPIPRELLNTVLADAKWSPSWSNTHPYFLAIAEGEKLTAIKSELLELFDIAYPGCNW